MKKIVSIILIVALVCTLGITAFAAGSGTVTVSSATYDAAAKEVSVSGTTSGVKAAVIVQVVDGTSILAMESFTVSGNAFSGTISGLTLETSKTYTVKVADFDGGAWATKTFAEKSKPVTPTAPPVEPDDEPFPFVDVTDPTAFYYDAVKWAVEEKITKGTDDTHFSPFKTCTRAETVTFLWRAAGCPEPTAATCKFTDVKATAYYYKAVLWAVENGITNGTSDTTFSPDDTVSRGQVVTFLYRLNGSEAVSVKNDFTDIKSGVFYYDAVLWAIENDITKGTSKTTFSPDDDCTRGQIVTFLYRNFVK